MSEAAAWVLALAIVALVLPALSYRTRDPDSRLYAEIAAQLSRQPPRTWIAPEWPAGWYGSGRFVEHPVGWFLLPAALGALGYPAAQAAYAVYALCQIGSLLLIAALASRFVAGFEARALLYWLQLIPIAFTYRVRANQEHPLLLLLLLALYAAERTRSRWAWAPLVAAACVGLVLVKGLAGLVGFPVCALWLLLRGKEGASLHGRRNAWLALLGALAAAAAATAAYQALYREATQSSFLAAYLERQVPPAVARQSAGFVAQKAYNLVWYGGRLAWFPFPWSLGLVAAAVAVGLRRLRPAPDASSPPHDGEHSPTAADRSDGRLAPGGFLFAAGVALLYLALFSLSDRRADRYIFPAYFAVAAGGAIAASRANASTTRLTEVLSRLPRWAPAALWLALVLLHVGAGRLLHLPTIKLWDPSS